jgi:hypothetical protein
VVIDRHPLYVLIHDTGWTIAWRQIVKAEGRWPKYRNVKWLCR